MEQAAAGARQPMRRILLCDLGNTAIKIGVGASDAAAIVLEAEYALPSRDDATADSLGLEILAALSHAGFGATDFAICAAASVRPSLNGILRNALRRYFGCETVFACEGLPVPLKNRYERPQEVGADRLVGAWAARRAFSECPGLLVVDFGTALTFDCIDGDAYLGGLIFPGPATAAAALAGRAAKLPLIELAVDCQSPSPCRDTATSMRHGLAFGYSALTEGLCQKLAQQLPKPLKIIGTGGFAKAIAAICPVFDAIMPALLLNGLAALGFDHIDRSAREGSSGAERS